MLHNALHLFLVIYMSRSIYIYIYMYILACYTMPCVSSALRGEGVYIYTHTHTSGAWSMVRWVMFWPDLYFRMKVNMLPHNILVAACSHDQYTLNYARHLLTYVSDIYALFAVIFYNYPLIWGYSPRTCNIV